MINPYDGEIDVEIGHENRAPDRRDYHHLIRIGIRGFWRIFRRTHIDILWMDGKMHGWMDVLVGSMAKWKDPNDDDVLTPGILRWRSLSVGGFFSLLRQQSDQSAGSHWFHWWKYHSPTTRTSWKCVAGCPSYPPSRSPNTSPELRSKTAPTAYCWVSVRLRPASAIWSAFTWPSLGQWRQWLVTTGDGWATYISATASQVSYISLKKWSASFDWGHVEGKKLRKYNNVWSWKYHQRCFGTRG